MLSFLAVAGFIAIVATAFYLGLKTGELRSDDASRKLADARKAMAERILIPLEYAQEQELESTQKHNKELVALLRELADEHKSVTAQLHSRDKTIRALEAKEAQRQLPPGTIDFSKMDGSHRVDAEKNFINAFHKPRDPLTGLSSSNLHQILTYRAQYVQRHPEHATNFDPPPLVTTPRRHSYDDILGSDQTHKSYQAKKAQKERDRILDSMLDELDEDAKADERVIQSIEDGYPINAERVIPNLEYNAELDARSTTPPGAPNLGEGMSPSTDATTQSPATRPHATHCHYPASGQLSPACQACNDISARARSAHRQKQAAIKRTLAAKRASRYSRKKLPPNSDHYRGL